MKPNKSKYFQIGLTLFLSAAAAIVFYTLLFDAAKIKGIVTSVAKTMSPVLWGIFIAYILWYVIKWVQKYFDRWIKMKNKKRKTLISRSLAIVVGLIVMIGAIAAMIYFIVPSLADAVVTFVNNLSTYEKQAQKYLEIVMEKLPVLKNILGETTELAFDTLGKWIQDVMETNLARWMGVMTSGVVTLGKGLLNFIVGIIVAVYILASKEKFMYQANKLLWALFNADRVRAIHYRVHRAKTLFDNFVIGKMVDSLIIGVICFIGLSILKMPYTSLISVTVAVTNMIPIVGPFIGAVPSAFLLLLVDPMKCLIFVIFVLALQQLDGQIIGPKILGNSVGVSAFWIIVALLIGGAMFGIVGMFFAVPVMAFMLEALKDYSNARLKEKGIDGRGNPIVRDGDPDGEDSEAADVNDAKNGLNAAEGKASGEVNTAAADEAETTDEA